MRSRRLSLMVLTVSVVGLPSVSLAEVGALLLDLTHNGGSNSDVIVSTVTGGSIPIEVSFTATNSGTSGSNRGVASVSFDLFTGLPLIDQVPMTLSPLFTNAANAGISSTAGAGFNLFGSRFGNGTPTDVASDGFMDAIAGIGDSQAVNAPQFKKPNGTQGRELEFAGHLGPIRIATGQIMVAPGTPEGTYVLSVMATAVGFWDHTSGGDNGPLIVGLGDTFGTGDTLVLIVVPEPATVLLLGPVGWAMVRRRWKAC